MSDRTLVSHCGRMFPQIADVLKVAYQVSYWLFVLTVMMLYFPPSEYLFRKMSAVTLDLEGDRLTGPIPTELGSLVNLGEFEIIVHLLRT